MSPTNGINKHRYNSNNNNRHNFSRRSFSFSAPTMWNKLPAVIRESDILATFKRQSKTHLTSLTTRNAQPPLPSQQLHVPQIRLNSRSLCVIQIVLHYHHHHHIIIFSTWYYGPGTTITRHQLTCGEDPPHVVIRQ